MDQHMWKLNKSGFTLVEFLTVLAIAAIFMTMVIPGYRAFIQNNKVVSAANKLSASFNFARLEAVKRGSSVVVCPTANSAFSACGNSAQWSQGWIIFADADQNNAIESSTDLVKIADGVSNEAMISTSSGAVSYDGTGFVSSGAASFLIKMAGCTGSNARTISVSSSGRVSVAMAACD